MAKRLARRRAATTAAKAPPRERGQLIPMRVSTSYRDFVLDQLGGIDDDVRAKAMFGGIGLYAGDVFFGMIAADTLYLKVDDTNRARYVDVGSAAFKPYADRPMTMPYYNVPANVLEDPATLAEWAALSIGVARVAGAAKSRKSRR
jgi:DNA transformation protein